MSESTRVRVSVILGFILFVIVGQSAHLLAAVAVGILGAIVTWVLTKPRQGQRVD